MLNVPGDHPNIQAAVAAAVSGDEIKIAAGTFPISSTVVINVSNLTITGAGVGSTIISTDLTAGTNVFQVLASDFKLQDVEIIKTDKPGIQNLIWINANNASILNNSIHGQFVIGEGDVSRAMVVSGGLSGLLIDGNTFYALRQPLYVTGTTTGNVSNNLTYGTKGWVLEGGNLTFTGNTWGTGAQANVFDIAIIPSCPAAYYTDIVAMSAANNNAVIEDQRSTPLLSVVYVDKNSTQATELGSLLYPYKTIAPAITRVVAGGTIKVAAGTYNESPTISKSLSLLGAGRDVTNIVLQTAPNYTGSLLVGAANVTVSGFTITGYDAVGSGLASTNIYLNSNAVNVTISNNKLLVGKIGSGSTGDDGFGFITEYNVPATPVSNLTVSGNIFQPVGTEGQRAFYINPGVDNFTFTNNTITGQFNKTAITQAKNGLVENNTITGTGSSMGFGTYGDPNAAIYGKTKFSNNAISGVARGIAIYGANNVVIENNTLTNNVDGVWVGYDVPNFDPTTISISSNNITGSTGYGVNNTTPTVIDATCNWWGSSDALVVATKINGPVTYAPFSVSQGGACLGGIPATTVVAIVGTPTSTTCGTLDVPITVKNFKNIGTVSLRLKYDVTKLQLKAIPDAAGPWPGVTINPVIASLAIPNEIVPGTFTLGYYVGLTGNEVNLDDDAVLFTLHFTKVPLSTGTTSLTWSDEPNTGYCEFSAKNGTVYSSIFNDEQVINIPTWPVKNINTGLDYCTIQAAIDAVQTLNTHTITVAAGTYNESVLVNKQVTILGAQKGVLAKGRSGGESVVDPNSTAAHGFKVVTDNVTIDGFTITNSAAYPASERYGIVTIEKVGTGNFNNIKALNNLIQRQRKAINFNGTDNFEISGNWLNGEGNSYNGWCVWVSDYGTSTANGLIKNNDLDGYSVGVGIHASNANPATVMNITENRSIGSQYVMFGLQNSTVYRNSILNVTAGTHMYIGGGCKDVVFSENFIDNGTSNGFSINGTDNTNLTITNNSITGHNAAGKFEIRVDPLGYSGTLDAHCNWLGISDPNAIAAKVSGPVDYTPWLLVGTDGSADPGFQPSVGCDETPPQLTCPVSVTVDQHMARDPYATGYATTLDAADVITYNDNRAGLNLCNATGVIVRTWTATDLAGNKSTCVQTITVEDVDNPVAVVPANITVNNDPGLCTAIVTYPNPTATDFGFFQGFENAAWVSGASDNQPSTDWNNSNSLLTRVTSAGSILPKSPSTAFGLINSTGLSTAETGIFSRLGGYDAIAGSFGNGFVTSLDVYFDLTDTKVANSTYGWDLTTAVSNQANGHLRDFIFHAAGEPGKIMIAADNNTNGARRNDLASINHYDVTTSGWYTLKWTFRNNAGVLAVDCQLLNAGGTVLWTETRTAPTDLIASVVGGNRYMWFTFLAADRLAIDNTTLTRNLAVTPASLSGTAFAKGTTTVSATAVDVCGKTTTSSFTVTVVDNEVPVFTAPTPVIVHVNKTDCKYDGLIVKPAVTDNCTNPVTNIVNDMPVGGWPVGVHTITWTATDASGNFATTTQTVTVVKNAVTGKMVYYNSAETQMGNVTLELYEGAVLKGTATTSIVAGHVGEFAFTGLCNGTYKVVVTDNKKETGYINNTDAILVNSWSASPVNIEHVKFLAGDVTFNKFITSADALKIQRQYVYGDVFVAPLWSYWKQGDAPIVNNRSPYDVDDLTDPLKQWPLNITVTVNGGDATLNLYAMGTGDFNGSFTPNITKSANPSLILTENSNLQVGANQAFELPMVAASAMQVSAVSMSLLIPSNLVEVQDVVMKNNETPVVWSVKGNELRIGWYSLDPVNVAENGSLLTLKLKTSNAFTAGQSLDISLPFDPLNELADGRYKAMESAELMVAKVGNQTVGTIGIDNNGGLLFSNYPNPFSKVTTLEYNLPVDGKVTINLFNNLGQLVSVLVDADQSAGQHKFRYETNTLQPGIYVAKLRLVNSETDMVGTIKLSVQK